MNFANQASPRRVLNLLAIPALLLLAAALCLASPAPAEAKVRVVAKVKKASPAAVRVVARTERTVKRVVFLVDGRKRTVRRSVDWRHGRKGVLRIKRLRPGKHRVTAVAVHPRGRVSRGVQVIRLGRKGGRGKGHQIGVGPGRPVDKPTEEAGDSGDEAGQLPPGVLFDGGFDNGYDGWHVQALSYRTWTFDDGFSGAAARFEVHDGDVEPETGSERAEVSGASFEEGQDLYVRDTIRVPASSNSDTDWQLIQQLREHDWCCSPGMAVFLDDDRELRVGAGDSWPMYWRGPELEADRWYDLVYRVKLSQSSSEGFVEVWLDGVQQTMLNGNTRIYGPTIQKPRNYIKAGIYRSESSTGTTVVDHDNVIVGTSYAAVMAAG